MAEIKDRILPVGIQSFEEIRKKGYLYVDKTDIIWQLANRDRKYNYLNRPRRFGKSVLVDTLQAYFEGRKELFEGLKIMDLETEWTKHPVIRLDMSRAGSSAHELNAYLNQAFKEYEQKFSIEASPANTFSNRFDTIIQSANQQTGQQVVVLVEGYDSPLLNSWNTPHHEECVSIYLNVFTILKADDEYEEFVLITGTTKFTKLSLFSGLNNLSNISFEPEYAAICGITKEELHNDFKPEIEKLAVYENWIFDEAVAQLQAHYGGYHFSRKNMVDVFNPFSLIKALSLTKIDNYWDSSETAPLLPPLEISLENRLEDLGNCALMNTIIETADVSEGGAELFFYQSGYLTIKGYYDRVYLLGFPNHEVRQALYEMALSVHT
jgi:hypothetical protein